MWQALRRLIAANPMGLFLWAIISKWYVTIALGSLIVLYWVVVGLGKIGLITYMRQSTVEIFEISKAIAQNCTTKLGPNFDSLVDFWQCLGNPPQYEVKEDITHEKALERGLDKILPKDRTVPEMLPFRNPYDEPSDSSKSTDGK